MELQNIAGIVLGMAGFGAFVSALVNVGKSVGIVKDGYAQTWVTGLNILGVSSLFIAQAAGIDINLEAVNANFGTIATILVAAGQLVVSLGGSKIFYAVTKGTPVLGKSLSA